MRSKLIFILVMLSSLSAMGQTKTEDQGLNTGSATFVPLVKVGETKLDGEMVQRVELNKLYSYPPRTFKNEKAKQKYDRMVYNVKKVLPIAKEVRGIVIETYETIATIPNKKERQEHMKLVEKEIKATYTPRMKKLTLKQGKLLIKLVYRETNSSGYGLLKAFLGPVRAGFYQAFAWTFGASLAKKFDPENNEDDREIDAIVKQVEAGQI